MCCVACLCLWRLLLLAMCTRCLICNGQTLGQCLWDFPVCWFCYPLVDAAWQQTSLASLYCNCWPCHMLHTMCLLLCDWSTWAYKIHESSDCLTDLPDQPINRHRITLFFYRTVTGQLCVTSSLGQQPNTSCLRIGALVVHQTLGMLSTMQAPLRNSPLFRSSQMQHAMH